MPGIVGYQGIAGGGDGLERLRQMAAPLLHRSDYQIVEGKAPIGGGVCVVGGGVGSLLVGAADDGEISVVYYGEFYDPDFADASTGSEIASRLIALYRRHGSLLPVKLDGSFVVYLAELRSGKVVLFNDHYGSRQLFYSDQGGRLLFAPESKGIAAVPDADRGVDRDAFVSFLVNGAMLGEANFYRKIHPVLPGRVVSFEGGTSVVTRSTRYEPDGSGPDRGESSYIEELSALLRQSVRRRFRDPSTTAIPLSGGIDSRGILGIAHELHGPDLRVVTWGKDDVTPGADVDVARRVAAHLGIEHRFVPRTTEDFESNMDTMLWRMDGLTDDPAHHHGELGIMTRLRNQYGVRSILRGEECFGHWPEPPTVAKARANTGVHELSEYPNLAGLFRISLRPELVRRSRELIEQVDREYAPEGLIDRRDHYYFSQRLFHYHTRCAYFKLTEVDVKSPWLDRPIIDFLARLPAHYRTERRLYRRCLETMYPDLMAIPTANVNSLEDWTDVIRKTPDLQALLRRHLFATDSPILEWIDREALVTLAERTFAQSRPRPPSRLLSWKNALRKRVPLIYSALGRAAGGKINFYPLAASTMLFRVLLAKRWFDRFEWS